MHQLVSSSNPVPFDRSKSAVSLGAPFEPRALKHRTRSRAPVGPTVVECPVGNCAPSASTGCDETPRRRRPSEGGAMTEIGYALYVGIDWGTVTHQVAVLDAQRVPLGERAIAHEAVALHALTARLNGARGPRAPPPRPRAGG